VRDRIECFQHLYKHLLVHHIHLAPAPEQGKQQARGRLLNQQIAGRAHLHVSRIKPHLRHLDRGRNCPSFHRS